MTTDWSGYNTTGALRRTIKQRLTRDETFEHIASGILKPGHVLKRDSNNKVLVHSSAGIPAERLIAGEDWTQGKTIDEAYAVGDPVQCLRPLPGDQVLLRLAAAASAIVIGDKLTVHSDGTVKKRTVSADTYTDAGSGTSTFSQEQDLFAIADVAVDNSGGSGEVFILATIQ